MSLFSSNDEHFCTPFALHNQNNNRRGQIEISRLEPENEFGNVEYKLRLTNPTPERIERLVTQLKWRIREGNGEAIIFLGVKDDGLFVGLTPEEIKLSLQTLEKMSSKIGASLAVVKERIVEPNQDENQNLDCILKSKSRSIKNNKIAYEQLHKENFSQGCPESSDIETQNQIFNESGTSQAEEQQEMPVRKVLQVLVKRKTHDISEELRVAVLGPSESGKSSLLGVLSHGEYDNGRGSARLNLFRHRHEIRSGHTSSISQEIFGFTPQGQPLTYGTCLTSEEIIESASRVVSLIDLAGHQRYLGTTLFGLNSHAPDLVLIVICATSAITNVTTDHISLALGMEKSTAIIINKTDLASIDDQEICYEDITKALRHLHPKVRPIKISTLDNSIMAGSKLGDPTILPIFFTSCVTGSGIASLYAFFNEVSPILNDCNSALAISQLCELQVDETFQIPGIGTVVSGLMIEGTIREGDEMLLGPDDLGNFSDVSIVSLQRHKIPCNFARAGQKCTMAIVAKNIKVRRGMVMRELDHDWKQNFSVCYEFEARIKLISKEKHKLRPGSQLSAYIGNVKQTCSIISTKSLPNNNLLISLKLTKRPEYIREGSRIIIKLTLIKGIGTVSRVKIWGHRND